MIFNGHIIISSTAVPPRDGDHCHLTHLLGASIFMTFDLDAEEI